MNSCSIKKLGLNQEKRDVRPNKNKPMRKLVQNTALIMCSMVLIWACDNGYSEVPIVDTPPSIELGSITSGTTEGEDFVTTVTVKDAVEGSDVSRLGTLNYEITTGGVNVASGSEALQGWEQTVTITVTGGFDAGDYNLDVTVSDSNGNTSVDNESFTVGSAAPAFDITGEWRMAPIAASFQVGPTPGSGEWFANSEADVTTRACYFDDTYTFNADGSLVIAMGDETWLEDFQGVNPNACGTPIAPYNGGSYTYTYSTTEIKVIGEGAFLGLPKVNNAGELPNVDVPSEITYTIVEQTEDGDTRNMTLRIEAGDGVWWDYKMTSGPAAEPVSLVGNWKVEPIAGALGVGPTEGSTEWFATSADDVTTRDCYFDDVYTFNEDGTFTIEMGDQTWLEDFQGVNPNACGAPIAPYDGSGTYNYTFDGANLTLSGEGAFIGLPKVNNAGELPNVDVPSDITYSVISLTQEGDTKRMTIHIEAGSGVWWTYKLISE